METRINLQEKGQKAFGALYGIRKHLEQSALPEALRDLIYLRVSQINGCAFCLDMHAKDLRANGESEQRLYLLDAWRESPCYTDKERAALAWAEALTRLEHGLVPAPIFNEARKHFSETDLIDLTLAVTAINTYNRINIAFGAPVGTYQVGQFN